MQNLTPLALSLAEKSVTVHTHTYTKKPSKHYIHTLPSACVDNNWLPLLQPNNKVDVLHVRLTELHAAHKNLPDNHKNLGDLVIMS